MLAFPAEDHPDSFDDDDGSAEVDQDLVLVRPAVEPADQHPLEHHPGDEHEEGAADEPDDERAGGAGNYKHRVRTQHEQRTVREVEHAERAENDGKAAAYERQQRSKREAIEGLREEQRRARHAAFSSLSW